jgi:Raf kinase inhibitor-like YbhB/YbcL family protein
MKISSVFKNNETIPKKYTCQGDKISPPLNFENIPKNTKSLALIVDDPDAPYKTFVHWVLFNNPIISKIEEDSTIGLDGLNSLGSTGYTPPCPPTGEHRYFFKLYALDKVLDLKDATKEDLEKAMQGHVIEKADLIGLYKKI